jgi:hypothetical protein
MALLRTLTPPSNDAPLRDDSTQHSPAWRGFFEDVSKTLKDMPGAVRKGVVDGSSAAAGDIGELLQGVNGTPVAAGAGVAVNAASLALTAGDWDVRGEAWINITANASSMNAAISPTSGGLPALSGSTAQTSQVWVHTAGLHSLVVGPCRVSLTATTVYNLVTRATGVASTGYGKLEARRIR